MLGVLCMEGRKGKRPGEGCAIKAATTNEASCRQELLELLDEQICAYQTRKAKSPEVLYLSCHLNTLSMNYQSSFGPHGVTYPSLKDTLSANLIVSTD